MASNYGIGNHATTVAVDEDGITRVTYHNTVVVAFDHTAIVLDTGGWQTPTTKRRMNDTALHYGLDYAVYQRNFKWYIGYRGETIPFPASGRATLYRKGEPIFNQPQGPA